jgi:hypothetical protein
MVASEARVSLLKAAEECQGPACSLAHLLLAEVEASGSQKKKEERIGKYLSQVCCRQIFPVAA